jgi:hypothetical protein
MPKTATRDIMAAMGLFALVAFGCGPITTQTGHLCMFLGLPATWAIFIMSVIAAPVVEEGAKRIGIAKGMPWLFVFEFAAIEFCLYLLMGADAVLRIPAAVMHIGTMYVQMHTTNMSKKGGGVAVKFLLWGGWLAAVAIHALFNWAVLNAR